MRLTVEEHREAIKRYSHLKPARGWGVQACSARLPEPKRSCTLKKGHRGPHVAHGAFRKVMAVWEMGTGAPVSADMAKRATPPSVSGKRSGKRPVGLRPRTPVGFYEGLRALVKRTFSSAEEIAFIVLFLVIAKLALDVLLSLFR